MILCMESARVGWGFSGAAAGVEGVLEVEAGGDLEGPRGGAEGTVAGDGGADLGQGGFL